MATGITYQELYERRAAGSDPEAPPRTNRLQNYCWNCTKRMEGELTWGIISPNITMSPELRRMARNPPPRRESRKMAARCQDVSAR